MTDGVNLRFARGFEMHKGRFNLLCTFAATANFFSGQSSRDLSTMQPKISTRHDLEAKCQDARTPSITAAIMFDLFGRKESARYSRLKGPKRQE